MEKLKVIIGRDPQSCDYQIENAGQHGTVSGRHATLSATDNPDSFLFEDHSTNGSYINGQYLHNDRCMVGINDHITLGKTYVLPMEDIVKRYLSHSRTTKRKPVNQTPSNDAYFPSKISTTGDGFQSPSQSTDNGTQRPQENVNPTRFPETPIVGVKAMPKWYWILLIGALIIGGIIGACL